MCSNRKRGFHNRRKNSAQFFKINPGTINKPMSESQAQILMENVLHLLMIIIDERSLLSQEVLGASERNCWHSTHWGKNSHQPWGGVPIILVFGDDYQLHLSVEVHKDVVQHTFSQSIIVTGLSHTWLYMISYFFTTNFHLTIDFLHIVHDHSLQCCNNLDNKFLSSLPALCRVYPRQCK